MDKPWLNGLNPAQIEAVTHGNGPLLVIAGAGTGKTKTLAARVAHLIHEGVTPERILLLTFTRRAAAEMLRRADHLSGSDLGSRVWSGTFHAVANRLLRYYGRAISLPNDFTILDEGDASDLMNLLRSELGVAKGDKRFPRKHTLRSIFSRAVNAQEKLADVLKRHFPWCEENHDDLKTIFEAYVQRKREQNVLDYDDLLLHWRMLTNAPGIGDTLADRFDHVLVDEYQDTNAVQSQILRGMRKRCDNIMVVGDDAQAIYSFRAATVRNILDFPKQFPGARVVTLEQNYRSTVPILAASNAVMQQAKERYTKNLFSDRASGQKPILVTCVDETQLCRVVCEQVLAHLESGVPLMRQAVLFRTGHHSDMLEVELARRNIPFHKFGGLKFIEAAHIKDMLAFLRILENPYDQISWFRILLLFEGVGPRTAGRIMNDLGVRRDVRPIGPSDEAPPIGDSPPQEDDGRPSKIVGPLLHLFESPPNVPAAAKKQFERLRQTLADCCGITIHTKGKRGNGDGKRAESAPPPAAQVERVRAFYEPIFEKTYDNAGVRLRDLDQLAQIAAGYRSRARFVTDLTLDPPSSTSDLAGPPHLDEDWLTLSTIHSAKGCEWDVVFVLNAADGWIPSDMAISDDAGVEEERRLFYVALTRAKDMLYVMWPMRAYISRYGQNDRHGYVQLTRYITPAVKQRFELRTPIENTTAAAGPSSVEELDVWTNDLWR